MRNKFKAPQRPIRSSWRSEVFKNPKSRGLYTVKKSLGTGKVFNERSQGQLLSTGNFFHSNQY